MSDGDQMKKFLFVDDDGNIDVELWVEATDEKEARKLAWERQTISADNLRELMDDVCDEYGRD